MVSNLADLEALLYDWNNERRLRSQLTDVDFWAKHLAEQPSCLVVGCGTGRVSGELARTGSGHVVGVDIDHSRLRRAAQKSNCTLVLGDARALPFRTGSFSSMIFPYSGFQLLGTRADRHAALSEASRVVCVGGAVWLDVSENFDRRSSAPKKLVASGWSQELNALVREWETLRRNTNVLEIDKEFEIDDVVRFVVEESWTFASALQLEDLTRDLPLRLQTTHCGYGARLSLHRRIYVFKRWDDRPTAAREFREPA